MAARHIPRTAPPLSLQPLEWSNDVKLDRDEEAVAGGEDILGADDDEERRSGSGGDNNSNFSFSFAPEPQQQLQKLPQGGAFAAAKLRRS